MASKSVAVNGKLIPHWAVPALPGAMNNVEHKMLCFSFQASACSLPPEPSSKIFMMVANIGTIVKRETNYVCVIDFVYFEPRIIKPSYFLLIINLCQRSKRLMKLGSSHRLRQRGIPKDYMCYLPQKCGNGLTTMGCGPSLSFS